MGGAPAVVGGAGSGAGNGNAALEYLADQVHPDIAPGLAAAKDAAAGAVLLASGGALATAVLMLADRAYSFFS